MQSAGCQQTSRDVPNFVVTPNDESSAAYCRRRRCCPDTSSDAQLRTVLWCAHWWSHNKLPAVMETKNPSPLSQQRMTYPYLSQINYTSKQFLSLFVHLLLGLPSFLWTLHNKAIMHIKEWNWSRTKMSRTCSTQYSQQRTYFCSGDMK